MNLEILCLCVKNEIVGHGLPSIIGIFDRRSFAKEPCVFPPFVVFTWIRIFKEEAGRKQFDLVVNGPDGQIGRHSEILHIAPFAEESQPISVPYAVPNLVAVFGTYWFSVESPEGVLGRVPLYVKRDLARF